ncbi:DUF3566 domain-containing protein [Lapillicoccus jejuensis]|uniref:Transmembrane protein DUF3566 n=1 Tax=Lapillicoccus jejuensis TaxID=402171 RepID=A0A542DZ17_9MICO|nr:DUF3566 domain-containing protein [Lapillicoccus jejuensis]TQJ08341.1 transmembrane protein DUF3566 [Lapillicoccus jejuensis]
MSTTGQGGTPPSGGQRGSGTATSPRTQSTPVVQRPTGASGGPQGQRPQSRPAGAARPTRPAQPPRRTAPATARRVKLAVARVDPWSVMKMSFLLAVAGAIAGVVVTMVIWLVLSGMGVFSDVDRIIKDLLTSSTSGFELMDYIGFGRVISLAVVFGVINVILQTAIATLAAFLYNICAALVGGLQLTLTDD